MPRTKKEDKKLQQLGLRLREVREEKGYTQKELAHSIGKDQQTLQRIEAGRTNPTITSLSKICEALNIPVTELIDGIF